jgi:hypothetical protein
MARLQVADGGDDLQMWKVAANILNKQSRSSDMGLSTSFCDTKLLYKSLGVFMVKRFGKPRSCAVYIAVELRS